MTRHTLAAIAASAGILLAATACDPTAGNSHHQRGRLPAAPDPVGATSRADLLDLLDQVRVVDDRPHIPGYDRETSFGPEWTDEHDGRGGHNDCDTRNDVLQAQLTRTTTEDGCTVLTGIFDDPYTGQTIHFTRDDAIAVQIDHVYPLAYAWDMGASSWPADKRTDFANDQAHNLLASDGPTNASKSDSGPGEWLPPNTAYHCAYAARFLEVAINYRLPITVDDAETLHGTANTDCPEDPR